MDIHIYHHIVNDLQVGVILQSIVQKLDLIIGKQDKVMGAVDNLTAAIDALEAKVVELDAALQKEVKQLADALAAGDPVAVQAAADRITALSAKLTTDVAALQADDPALPPPPPAV